MRPRLRILASVALAGLMPAGALGQVERLADLASEEVTPEAEYPLAVLDGAVLWRWAPLGHSPSGYVEQLLRADSVSVRPLLSLSRAQGRQLLHRVREPSGRHLFMRRGETDTPDTDQVYVTDGTRRGSHRLEDLDAVQYGLRTTEWRAATYALIEDYRILRFGRLDPRSGAFEEIRHFEAVDDRYVGSDGFFIRDGSLHFVVAIAGQHRIFVTDGSPSGTRVAFDLGRSRVWPVSSGYAVLPSGAWVLAGTSEETGREPWIWDAEGLRQIVDLSPGPEHGVLGIAWASHGGEVWFPSLDGRLHRTDGTAEGTRAVPGAFEGVQWVSKVGDRLSVWDAHASWWLQDGDAFVPLGLRPRSLARFGEDVWLIQGDDDTPREFIHVDLETLRVERLAPPIPTALYQVGDRVIATLEPRPGAVPLATFGPSGPPLEPAGALKRPVNRSCWPGPARALRDAVLVEATLHSGAERVQVRLATGEPARVVDPPPDAQTWREGLVFAAGARVQWLDAIDEPATLVAEFDGAVADVAPLGGALLILTATTTHRPKLWRIDGLGAEPRQILPTAEDDLRPFGIRRTADGLVVYASDGRVWRRFHGPAGFEGSWVEADYGAIPRSSPYGLFTFYQRDGRVEAWPLDGGWAQPARFDVGPDAVWGRAGSRFVVLHSGRYETVDLVTGERSEGTYDGKDPELLGEMQDRLLFSSRWRDTGREPWVFDADGPRLLQDILPGPASSFPEPGAVIDGQLVFSAIDLDFGREAFATDGRAPPRLLFDLNSGPYDGLASGVDPAWSAIRGHVYFAGWDPEVGVEPHRFERRLLQTDPEAECRADADCPSGARCVGGACVVVEPTSSPSPDAGLAPPDAGSSTLDGLDADGCGCRSGPEPVAERRPLSWGLVAAGLYLRRRRSPRGSAPAETLV